MGHISLSMISVIIPTRNRAELLSATLDSIYFQTLPKKRFEVLVVDNNSSDHTTSVIKLAANKLDNLHYFFEPKLGLHNGRHMGLKNSKGDLLVFADDDIEALPTWLESIEQSFQDQAVAMVGGNNYPMFIGDPPIWLTELWNRQFFGSFKSISCLSVIEFTKDLKMISPFQIWGCNFAIRKSIVLDAGGFHPDGMPRELIQFRGDGESHISRYVEELSMKCVFHRGASVFHKITPERMTFRYFYERGFNQGISDSYTHLRSQYNNSNKLSPNISKKFFDFLKNLLFKIYDSSDVKYAMLQFHKGYKKGYIYHQSSYKKSKRLQEWVHKKTYL